MKYQNYILKFMLAKRNLLFENGSNWDYCPISIQMNILNWTDGRSFQVWKRLKYNIYDDYYGLGDLSCPYCICYKRKCEYCEYGLFLGKCEDDDYSLFRKIITQRNLFPREIFKNIVLREIIKGIEND